jgi:hypothetical protein
MAIGIYGVTRPTDIKIEDIDIYYNYMPDRETQNNDIIKVADSTAFLSECTLPSDGSDDNYIAGGENLLEGFFNLRLPADRFSQLGIYTIYIKPKQLVPLTVVDCSVLSSLPSVKGIIIDINAIPAKLQANNALQGYRIEYLNADGTKLRNTVRYVVTANKVVPVSENVGNTSQKAIRYRFDDAGTLMFLQVTPSSSSDVKPNVLPYIGNPGDTILISNTFFSPLVVEVELVENTIDTVANIIAGEQIKDIQNGILTYYDENRNIIKQFNLYEIKDDVTNVPLFEVKEKRTNIDNAENFNDITNGL